MLTWGYGKLDHAPAGDLLDQIAHALELDVSVYRHQAVSNMFYSFARLQKDSPTLCAAVETHVTDHAEDFSPQVRNRIIYSLHKTHARLFSGVTSLSDCLFVCAAGIDEHPVGFCEVSLCTKAIHRGTAGICS